MSGRYSHFFIRNRYFLALDLLTFGLSAVVSFVIRLETVEPARIIWGVALFLIVAVPVKAVIFLSCGMYRQYWANAGPIELVLAAFACLMSGGILVAIVFGVSVFWPDSQVIVPPWCSLAGSAVGPGTPYRRAAVTDISAAKPRPSGR
jgi:FlaA1/EpsC-like NDP-sugar epimerase